MRRRRLRRRGAMSRSAPPMTPRAASDILVHAGHSSSPWQRRRHVQAKGRGLRRRFCCATTSSWRVDGAVPLHPTPLQAHRTSSEPMTTAVPTANSWRPPCIEHATHLVPRSALLRRRRFLWSPSFTLAPTSSACRSSGPRTSPTSSGSSTCRRAPRSPAPFAHCALPRPHPNRRRLLHWLLHQLPTVLRPTHTTAASVSSSPTRASPTSPSRTEHPIPASVACSFSISTSGSSRGGCLPLPRPHRRDAGSAPHPRRISRARPSSIARGPCQPVASCSRLAAPLACCQSSASTSRRRNSTDCRTPRGHGSAICRPRTPRCESSAAPAAAPAAVVARELGARRLSVVRSPIASASVGLTCTTCRGAATLDSQSSPASSRRQGRTPSSRCPPCFTL